METKTYIARARLGINGAVLFLVLGGLMAVLEKLVGGVVAGGAAALAAAATWYCNRRASRAVTANRAFYLWRLLPLLVFVLGPYAWSLWSASREGSLWTLTFEWLAPALAYVVPLLLLFGADWQLRLGLRAPKAASARAELGTVPPEQTPEAEQLPFAQ